MIYLDYQATTPVAPEAASAMRPWIEEKFANPHSPSREGREAAAAIEVARKQLQTQANFNLDVTLRQWEKAYVEAALNMTHGNLSQAAKLLGINRTTLYSRMQTYGTD